MQTATPDSSAGQAAEPLTRRHLMGGAAALALGGCKPKAAVSTASTSVTTQLGWLKDSQWAGVYVAENKGFFSEQHISSRLFGGGPNAISVPQALSGGSAKFGLGSSLAEVAAAVKAGSDLVVLGSIWQQNLSCIISLPAKPVRSISDLSGMRVGTTAPQPLRALFSNLGLKDVTIVKAGGDIAPLLDGDVDAFVGFVSNQVVILRAQGIQPVVFFLESLGWADYIGPVVTARRTLRNDRKLVTAYLQALIEGHQLNRSDPVLGAHLITEVYAQDQGMDFDQALASNKIFIEYQASDLTRKNGLLWMDLDRVSGPIYRTLSLLGLTGLPPPASYIDLSVLAEVYGGNPQLRHLSPA